MSQQDVDALRAGYEAFARQDLPAVFAMFDEDIDWYVPDELPVGGRFHGHDGVMAFFGGLSRFDEIHVDPDRFLDAGERIVVEGRDHGRLHGQAYEVGFVHVWTLREGRAVAFREYMDSGKLLPLFEAAPAARA
jgi:ketosteroid isomerase-like protein